MIKCQVCSKEVKQITRSHLKAHQLTVFEYKVRFPDAHIIDEATSKAITSKMSGRTRTQEHKDNLSRTISAQYQNGRSANKGKLGKKDSDDTRELKRQRRLGKTHTQATKDKIGNAHRGKTQPREAVERQKITYRKTLEANGGGFSTGPRSQEVKDKISEIAKARPESEWRPKMEAAWEARRGVRLTDEQREKHRQATIKWMNENPSRVFNTKVELAFKALLEAYNIRYTQQFRLDDHTYDFLLDDLDIIVEVDGPQHWKAPIWGTSGKSQDEKDEMLQRQLEKDARENWIAGNYGYQIVRLQVGSSLDDGPGGPVLEALAAQGLTL